MRGSVQPTDESVDPEEDTDRRRRDVAEQEAPTTAAPRRRDVGALLERLRNARDQLRARLAALTGRARANVRARYEQIKARIARILRRSGSTTVSP